MVLLDAMGDKVLPDAEGAGQGRSEVTWSWGPVMLFRKSLTFQETLSEILDA
jgi:hypothetical protein